MFLNDTGANGFQLHHQPPLHPSPPAFQHQQLHQHQHQHQQPLQPSQQQQHTLPVPTFSESKRRRPPPLRRNFGATVSLDEQDRDEPPRSVSPRHSWPLPEDDAPFGTARPNSHHHPHHHVQQSRQLSVPGHQPAVGMHSPPPARRSASSGRQRAPMLATASRSASFTSMASSDGGGATATSAASSMAASAPATSAASANTRPTPALGLLHLPDGNSMDLGLDLDGKCFGEKRDELEWTICSSSSSFLRRPGRNV